MGRVLRSQLGCRQPYLSSIIPSVGLPSCFPLVSSRFSTSSVEVGEELKRGNGFEKRKEGNRVEKEKMEKEKGRFSFARIPGEPWKKKKSFARRFFFFFFFFISFLCLI